MSERDIRESASRWLVSLGAALILAACSSVTALPATTPPARAAASSQNPCSSYTCDGAGALINVAYPYRLSTHCGVLSTRFDGRSFYIDAIDPSTALSGAGLRNPDDLGTMTLVSAHLAVFRTSTGDPIMFVDHMPGLVGESFPFRVFVLAGGQHLIDRAFAGRLWQAQGTLPGVSGPPYGDGRDAFTEVDGVMTLMSIDAATFRGASGAEVRFTATLGPVLCD